MVERVPGFTLDRGDDDLRGFGGAAGNVLTVTARAGRSHFLPDTERFGFDSRFPDGNPDERFFIDYDSILTEAELGIDWTRLNRPILMAAAYRQALILPRSLRASTMDYACGQRGIRIRRANSMYNTIALNSLLGFSR